ncbi:cytosolic phospholipase A2 epsilon-like isoform X2 [Athene cunicularia]|uniref:cytosolic phospholipase A2 epsilon-like isoform X2 n=1 Tax=Athene cunicularia TaxID=194338 RepID=UPI000EF66719|nr:cytosolic phospholipase A2 epsilon-like isoform X2 [Athene cunicularia]
MGSSAYSPLDRFIQANPDRKIGIRRRNRERLHSPEDEPEVPQFCWLIVKIISMRNLRKADLLSQTDCYVKLWLPTASCQEARTRTVHNCRNPVWNETFQFMIQSEVKNILELTVCDEDTFTPDDKLLTVHFDVAKIQPGEKVHLNFELNPKNQEELEVEFLLENIPGVSENIITNGVLVSREVSCLEVHVNETKTKSPYKRRDFTFTVKGSYEETRDVSLGPCCRWGSGETTVFHYVKHSQPRLHMTRPKEHYFCGHGSARREVDVSSPLAVPLHSLDLGKEVTVMRGESYEVSVKEKDSCKNLDLRLGFDLCTEEQDFICKRKKVVAAALKNVLHLDEDLQEDEVPVVAVVTTAGGVRSMTAMFGSLLALQELGVLDCVSYISGLSATTWTMAKLYEDANWSQKDLREPVGDIRKHVIKSKLQCFSLDHMKYYEKELCERKQEGHKLSFTDLWGLFIDCMLHHQGSTHKLSDQQLAVNQGQNPLPIYLSLNVKDDFSTLDFKEWLEFTPYEVGFLKYGAFVRSEDFGSEFFMGHLMKKIPESHICFLEGTWSNIFSQNFMDAVYLSGHSDSFWHRWTRDTEHDIEEHPALPRKPHEQTTSLSIPKGYLSTTLREMMTGRPVVSTYHNFLKGLQLHKNYLGNESFCMWKDTVLDSSPNQLNEMGDYLKLVDTAFFINTSCPPVLRPERKVDVILHLNYSGGSQTLPLDLFSEYCLEHGIPFPSTELSQEDREHLKECYVFEDSLEAPILAYFPLVCDTFQKYKAPNVERSPAEMEQGRVDVSNCIAPYGTGLLTYTEENFNKLLNLCSYNILNNKHLILQALRTAVERKKKFKKCSSPQSS